MHPAIYEALILALMGSSGVAAGLLLGVRRVIPLTFLALVASAVLRVWTAFAVWSLGAPEWNVEWWIAASAIVLLAGGIFAWHHWRVAVGAMGVFGALSVVALATKYLLDVGERHHSDVGNVLGVAVIAIQGDLADLSPVAGSFKRGVAFPLMLALGPEGRILAAFTPLVYLMLLVAATWVAWQLIRDRVSWKVLAGVAGGVGLFSLTVPMFRAAMFYLNGHTLMGLAVLVMVGGFLLARQAQAFEKIPMAMILLGGVLGATARIEGVLLVLVVVAALVGQRWWDKPSDRLALFASLGLIGLTFAWWLSSLESPVLDRFGLSDWILVVLTLVGAVAAASPWLDRLRPLLVPAVAVILAFVLARVVWQSADPLGTVLAQWPNLGLGRGGWATAAHVFIGSAVLLGLRRRSPEYRWLVGLVVLVIGTILFSKTFDGGFGREGFYDSVNRMWLHVMPTIIVTTLVGYAELVQSTLKSRTGRTARIERNTTAPKK